MKFYGELLILFLLLLTNLRVFFVNHTRRDSLTALAPLCFCLAVLQLLAWGVDVFTIFSLIVSLFVFLSNFHAIFRYSEHLYVDSYSTLMKVWAVFTSIITAVAIVSTVLFSPIELQNERIGVQEKLFRYKGSFRTGFEPAHIFNSADGFLYEFSKAPALGQEPEEADALVLFIPDKRGDTQMYKPYLQLLAKENYTVCSANFFADDLRWLHSFSDRKNCRRFASVFQSLQNNQKYMSQKEFYTYNISLECNALLQLINENYGSDKKFFMISDVMGNTAVKDFAETHPDRVEGIFFIDSIAEYKTPGYGMIEQTDPLLAFTLGFRRDSKLTTPTIIVEKTKEMIKAARPAESEPSETVEGENDTESAE